MYWKVMKTQVEAESSSAIPMDYFSEMMVEQDYAA